MKREQIADLVLEALQRNKPALKEQFNASREGIGYFYLDDLLPPDVASAIYHAFPPAQSMRLRKSLRENKYIAAQMDQYDPLLEETLFAFQDPRIVAEVGDICGMQDLSGDENLYAGGISLMEQGQFLNPHLDNSHDRDRGRWRALNILYYVSPRWETEHGGNLEIWPHGVKQPPVTITSRFNRLAVMATHGDSWHSVSPVRHSEPRCCVSNYYFSELPLRQDESFHVTSFRGRPEQPLRDLFLRGDTALRMGIRKFFSRGLIETDHVYKKQVDVSQSED